MKRRAAPRARVVIEARAKLNLTLAVGPARGDGFHELVTVFQSISLADTLIVEPRRRGFTLEVRHEDASLGAVAARSRAARARHERDSGVPLDSTNLVLRAARRVADELDLARGARFTLIKRIPAGAGLGGGSADAAAALVALPRLHGLALSRARRAALARELGSDVPFALRGGTALGRGRGEILAPLDLEAPFRALIAVPRWRVSTPRAYARIDRNKLALTPRGITLRSAQILGRNQLSATTLARLGNTFEKVLGNRRSDFASLGTRLRRAGAVAVRMTGSGSAVFAVLGPGSPVHEVAGRFTGSESLYAVRSTRKGWRLDVP